MCDDPTLPAPIARMLEEYEELLSEHGMGWGEPATPYVRAMSQSRFMEVGPFWQEARRMAERLAPGADDCALHEVERDLNFDEVLRNALVGELPRGLAELRLTGEGHELRGQPQTVLNGAAAGLTLLLDNARDDIADVTIGGRSHKVGAHAAKLVDLDTATEVRVDGQPVPLASMTRAATGARLTLRAGFPCRWSVWTADGQGWYPEGVPAKRDFNDVPYFHGDDLTLDVPSEPLTVRVARGMEYGFAETMLTPEGETVVELTPKRIYDAAAKGWYGGDLHVHLNFTGDLVAPPSWAAAAQHGEDLHVLSLLAANVSGSRVLDREALEHWAGQDLPWSDAGHVARMGIEYRNDMFGHLHAFALDAPPSRYATGFEDTPDWPPTTEALRELRGLGGLVGYAHAFRTATETPEQLIGSGRPGCTARMAVVDAALGLVDSFELLHYSSALGSAQAYRRLIGAGNRIAAVAGTDSMLTFTRQRMEMVASPIGWERTYARVEGPLSAASYADAVRRGRTFATTGPFVELTVEGRGPGETLNLASGERVTVTAKVIGPEVEKLTLLTADGELASGRGPQVSAELAVEWPTYVVAVAEGGAHPRSMFTHVYAHTSPVYLDVDYRRVAREEDVRFCLRWLELLEQLVRDHARLESQAQLDDYLGLMAEARRVYQARLA